MLEDGFKSDKYSGYTWQLIGQWFLNKKDVRKSIKEFNYVTKIICFDGINDEKARIVSEALIDNYNRQKFK